MSTIFEPFWSELGFFFGIVRLYFRHCKVPKKKDKQRLQIYPLYSLPPLQTNKKNKLANHAKRKERERKKNLQKHEKLTRTTK